MMQSGISLVAGLGNPGDRYVKTRHNVGFWFLNRLQQQFEFQIAPERKFKAQVGHFTSDSRPIRAMAPTTYMNLSGQAVASVAAFYRIMPQQILIVHDELDLPTGAIRLKQGGGHGGHNGLRNIIPSLGSADFHRLRIGIGHPGSKSDVIHYVLSQPSQHDRRLIDEAISETMALMTTILQGQFQKAMNRLHTPKNNLSAIEEKTNGI